jgi:hypothetical protein
MIILSFDIGIKNLAYCLIDSEDKSILDWNVLDCSGTNEALRVIQELDSSLKVTQLYEKLIKDLETKFSSKIQKKDQPDTLYLKYFEDKNDVTIGTKEGKFNYLYVEVPRSIADSKEQFYAKILSELSPAQKKKIAEENQKKISHESGRYIIIDLPEEGLKLEFINNEKKSLHSAILFPRERQ